MDHRLNMLEHAVPRDAKMLHPSERTIGSDPGTGKANRAPALDDLETPEKILKKMEGMTVGARTLGSAAKVLHKMWTTECSCILSMSGAASMGQLNIIIAELIDRGLIKAIVCTGAIVTHGCSLEMGHKHFQVTEEHVDQAADVGLYNRGYNRVFDTIELEKSLEATGDLVVKIMKSWHKKTINSWEIHQAIGDYLNEKHPKEDGILHAAARAEIPVFVPAFTDSEIGLSYARYMIEGGDVCFDTFGDLERYAEIAKDATSLGILTLGGGVPRNWAQQIAPFFDTLMDRKIIGRRKPIRFKYGVRICPEFTEWGGLSGCTYSEGISWGKFTPTAEGGQFAEVYSDYTIVFPLLAKGVVDSL